MSILIEDLIDNSKSECAGFYNPESKKQDWFIAKPYPLFGIEGFINRLRDAYRVLMDKSRAYHYREDEINNESEK